MRLIVNGSAFDSPEGSHVSALIERMHLTGKRLAVELNGEIVARSMHKDTKLRDGDRIEIVQAIGGG